MKDETVLKVIGIIAITFGIVCIYNLIQIGISLSSLSQPIYVYFTVLLMIVIVALTFTLIFAGILCLRKSRILYQPTESISDDWWNRL